MKDNLTRTEDNAIVFVHPSSICESQQIGEGTRVWPFTHILDGAVVGRDCNIGEHAFIEGGAEVGDRVVIKNQVMIWDGVTIEDEVFVGPGVIFTNDRYPRSRKASEAMEKYQQAENWLLPTTIQHGASIGAGAIIVAGVTIGRYASVGAGAVVTRNVPNHRVVVGNPARPAGWACRCGHPLGVCFTCTRCERTYQLNNETLEAMESAKTKMGAAVV